MRHQTPDRSKEKAPAPRLVLFKNDRPRAIDRYIDFFGRSSERAAAEDACGERLLEALSDDDTRATA